MPSLSTFPENKSSLHHLSEVLPQYLSVSCSMKLWRCLALSLIYWETKKCYFSRTSKEGEKRRGANDCLSGSVLDPAIIRSALMARLRRAYRPISPNLNFTRAALLSPAALLWLLFFFYSGPPLQITNFSTHLCNFTFVSCRIKQRLCVISDQNDNELTFGNWTCAKFSETKFEAAHFRECS